MIQLPGIQGNTPIGFMAALGLLRVLVEECDQRELRLRWEQGYAVLEGIEENRAMESLLRVFPERPEAPEFNWTDTTRVAPEVFWSACETMSGNVRALAFMAGWGTDAVVRDGRIANTLFDMTGGRQKLLERIRAMADDMKANGVEPELRTALFGGAYRDQSSFGLDPAGVRSRALEAEAPTNSTPPGKPGLIWLAFESIPLHPVLPTGGPNRATTAGWRRDPTTAYVWPLWDAPLTLETIRFLRLLPVGELATRPGVSAVWSSRRVNAAKYMNFLPAVREH